MDLNEKMIAEIAGQLGLRPGTNVSKEDVKKLESKSDSELAADILRLKEQLRANNISYEKQAAMLRNLMPMMDAKQRARLQKIIGLIEK